MSSELVPLEAAPSVPAIAATDVLSAFLSGRKPTTVRAYASDLDHFSRWMDVRPSGAAVARLLSLTGGQANALVLAYKNDMLGLGLATATVGRRLAALRSVTKLARTLGQIPWTIEIESPRVEPRRDVRGPDRDERKRVFRAMRDAGDDPRARRDRAIVALLFGLGLRRGEVVALDLADVDFRARTVRVLGKGRAEKETLTMPAEVAKHLGEWALVRGNWPGPLFVRTDRGESTERLTGEGLARAVARLGDAAKLDRKLRPHGFRHSAITLLRSGGKTDRDTMAFSRHVRADTLRLYDDTAREAQGKMAGDVARELK